MQTLIFQSAGNMLLALGLLWFAALITYAALLARAGRP